VIAEAIQKQKAAFEARVQVLQNTRKQIEDDESRKRAASLAEKER